MRTLDEVPELLWDTPCPLCHVPIARADAEAMEDGAVQVTFSRGEWCLLHTACLAALHADIRRMGDGR